MTPEFGSLPLDESSDGFADATGKSKLPSSSSAAVLSSVVQKFHSVNCNGSTVVVVASPTCKNKIDVERKKYNYKTVIECVKESNIFIELKKTCLGVLE